MKLRLKRNQIAVLPSPSFEREYLRILENMNRAHAVYIRDNILPTFQVERVMMDAPGDQSAGAFAAFREAMKRVALAVAEGLMNRLFEVEAARGNQKFASVASGKLGVDLAGVFARSKPLSASIALRVSENARLIKNLSESQITFADRAVLETLQNGGGAKALKTELAQGLQISNKRAILIARDQTAKFNSDLSRIRQQEAGIDRYQWETAGDERVRASHRENDGKIFSWSEPPSATGHPGHDVNCRCVAIGLIA